MAHCSRLCESAIVDLWPGRLVWGKACSHQKLAKTFPWIDNCLMVTKRDFFKVEASLWPNEKSRVSLKIACLPRLEAAIHIPDYSWKKWMLSWWWWGVGKVAATSGAALELPYEIFIGHMPLQTPPTLWDGVFLKRHHLAVIKEKTRVWIRLSYLIEIASWLVKNFGRRYIWI